MAGTTSRSGKRLESRYWTFAPLDQAIHAVNSLVIPSTALSSHRLEELAKAIPWVDFQHGLVGSMTDRSRSVSGL